MRAGKSGRGCVVEYFYYIARRLSRLSHTWVTLSTRHVSVPVPAAGRGVLNLLKAEMPDISVGAQVFDLTFHPTESIVYAGLLTGEVKAFGYDEQGQHDHKFTLKPSKRSCRGLAINEQGDRLWSVGKGKSLWSVAVFSPNPLPGS